MSVNHTAHTWGTEEATSTLLNAEVKDLSDGLQEPWDSYTPTWRSGLGGTTLSVGNGTLAGTYRRVGKSIDAQIVLLRGSTTNLGATYWTFELPAAPSGYVTGCGHIYDASATTAIPVGVAWLSGSEVMAFNYAGTRLSNTGPITWATSDQVILSVRYEAS